MKILLTGANGFIARNLAARLAEDSRFEILPFYRSSTEQELASMLSEASVVVHLAGENRPKDPNDFVRGNAALTGKICDLLLQLKKHPPVIFASSTQAELQNPYGESKLVAETAIQSYVKAGGCAAIYRLPNVFGKWCKPDYNSVVATFCHNISKGIPIQIHNPQTVLNLVYIDDVVDSFLDEISRDSTSDLRYVTIDTVYSTTLGALAEQIHAFRNCRENLVIERVGTGFIRALYSTYISYFEKNNVSYPLPMHGDSRGVFVEMLKTYDSGQFSYFTAHPGVTRGSHYHHTKTEKFLVIRGQARFRFRHLVSGETFELLTSEKKSEVVESIPGYVHDITNIGDKEMIVLIWANENFDRDNPDTIARKV